MYELIALQEVDAVVEPCAALAITHVGSHHEIPFAAVGLAADIGVTLSTLDEGILLWIHDSLAFKKVMVMKTVAREGISCKFAIVAHVAIEIAIVAFLQILCREWQRDC